MIEEMMEMVAAAGAEAVAALEREVKESYRRKLNVKTGNLLGSIAARYEVTVRGEEAMLTVWVEAGGIDPATGNWCWHGWFHEYGTGVYVEARDEARKGYRGPDGNWMDFNNQRPPAGKGWLIVKRDNPNAVISRGVPAKHWFSEGAARGLAEFDAIAGRLSMDLMEMAGMVEKADRVRKMVERVM